MKNTMMALLFMLMLMSVSFGQACWEHSYGEVYDDKGAAVCQTSDGGFLILGTSEISPYEPNTYILKVNASGTIISTRRYTGWAGFSEGHNLIRTTDGGFAVVGQMWNDIAYTDSCTGIWLLKLNSSGDTVWTKLFQQTYFDSGGGGAFKYAQDIKQTTDGGYILVGWETRNAEPGYQYNILLIKTDINGNRIWEHSYSSGSRANHGYSVVQSSDGGYIVVGQTSDLYGDYSDVYVVKTNSLGSLVWDHTYGGAYADIGYSITQTPDDGYIIVGKTESFAEYGTEVYIIKVDALGNEIWSKNLSVGDSYNNAGYDIKNTTDGGYIILGDCSDISLIKLDSSGDSVWTKSYDGHCSFLDWLSRVHQTDDGGYIFTGIMDPVGPDDADIYVVKTDATGWSEIKNTNSSKPRTLSLTAFPNPFNSSVAITVSGGRGLASQTLTNIKVYDLRGNVVYAPSSVPSSSGHLLPEGEGQILPSPTGRGTEGEGIKSTFIWQPDKSIASGIYFVRATMGDGGTITKRIVLIK